MCKTIVQQKLQGGMLYYALSISLLMVLIVNAVLLMALYSSKQFVLLNEKAIAKDNCSSALNLCLANEVSFKESNPTDIKLWPSSNTEVSALRKSWGAFYVIQVSQNIKSRKESLVCLVGSAQFISKLHAFSFLGKAKRLSVGGGAVIEGVLSLDGNSVKKAYLPSKPFMGSISNVKYVSAHSPLNINKPLVDLWLGFLNENVHLQDSLIFISEEEVPTVLNVSFADKPICIYSSEELRLENKKLNGQVIIFSETSVIIENNNMLSDVIIYAPEIIIRKGFKGSIQLWAKNRIIIEKDCVLRSPSAVALYGGAAKDLLIDRNAVVIGDIYVSPAQDKSKKSDFTILSKARVYGLVYSEIPVTLKGELYGSLHTVGLIDEIGRQLYQNHIIDATLSSYMLPDTYVSSCFFLSDNYKQIKWLD